MFDLDQPIDDQLGRPLSLTGPLLPQIYIVVSEPVNELVSPLDPALDEPVGTRIIRRRKRTWHAIEAGIRAAQPRRQRLKRTA